MTTASSHLRDTAKDAREGMREIGKAATAASGNIEKDLQALREDFRRLAEEVRDILTDTGSSALQHARSGIDDAVADAKDRGREAAGAVRDVSDNFVDAVDESIKSNPYATLAIVAGLGFLFGATWRR